MTTAPNSRSRAATLRTPCCLIVLALAHLFAGSVASGQGTVVTTLGPLVPLYGEPPGPDGCISAEELAVIFPPAPPGAPEPGAASDAARRGPAGVATDSATAGLFVVQPVGGTQDLDVMNYNFMDLPPEKDGALLSYSCDQLTYDAHRGHDVLIRSFGYQDAGVPVFAARDGTVSSLADGHFDKQVSFVNAPANYVIVDHADGSKALYWHLRKDSVAVVVDQVVRAGEQLGEVGSSGFSIYPHLHLQYHRKVGSNYPVEETMSGPCNALVSGWLKQQPLDLVTHLVDFGATSADLSAAPPPPEPPPVSAQIALSDTLSVWFIAMNVPANASFTARFLRPNGTLGGASIPQPMGNAEFVRGAYQWAEFDVEEMHTIAGTWRVQLDIDGTQLVDAPIEVVAAVDPDFNRPPAPIAVVLEPAKLLASRPIECRVLTDAVLDDPDWDIVRYHYFWTVNGVSVREVITGATRDVLAAGVAQPGDLVSCCVGALDDSIRLPPVCAEGTAVSQPWIDIPSGMYGSLGTVPYLEATGPLTPASPGEVALHQALPFAPAFLALGLSATAVPFKGGVFVPSPLIGLVALATDASGAFTLSYVWPPGVPSGATLAVQVWIADPAGPVGFSSSNTVLGTAP